MPESPVSLNQLADLFQKHGIDVDLEKCETVSQIEDMLIKAGVLDGPKHFSDCCWEVHVGNIGCVYCGGNELSARSAYNDYVQASKTGFGRAGHEQVALYCNGEPREEYKPDCRKGTE